MTRRCIQFVFSLWLGAIAVLSAGSARDAHALAPLDYIGPDSVKVAPPVPAPGQSATLTITDSTGVAAQVDEQSFAVRPGNILELRAKIALGYAEVIGSYTLVQDLGALEAGTYTVQYIAEARRIDQQYTGETKSWSWQLVVVDPMAKRNAIEYYNLTRNHYFVTSLQLEIDMLDSGQFSGWDRTGQSIQVVSPTASAAGFADVCRFYGLPEAGLDTHFYSAYRSECDSLIATGAGAWVLESDDAFRIFQWTWRPELVHLDCFRFTERGTALPLSTIAIQHLPRHWRKWSRRDGSLKARVPMSQFGAHSHQAIDYYQRGGPHSPCLRRAHLSLAI